MTETFTFQLEPQLLPQAFVDLLHLLDLAVDAAFQRRGIGRVVDGLTVPG